MKLTKIRNFLFSFFVFVILNQCVAIPLYPGTTPWLVAIKKYDVLNQSGSEFKLHCIGVLMENEGVVTSKRCLDTFPVNSHMVLLAGDLGASWTNTFVQKFLSYDVLLSTVATIAITPPIQRTKYVDYIDKCKLTYEDIIDTGFQYSGDDLGVSPYNLTNSSALCLEVNEPPFNKYCAYHNCKTGPHNIGGEPLTYIDKGQSKLIGFWDYDACDKNIRVFDKWPCV